MAYNFEYLAPTKVYFGAGVEKDTGRALSVTPEMLWASPRQEQMRRLPKPESRQWRHSITKLVCLPT